MMFANAPIDAFVFMMMDAIHPMKAPARIVQIKLIIVFTLLQSIVRQIGFLSDATLCISYFAISVPNLKKRFLLRGSPQWSKHFAFSTGDNLWHFGLV
jgi:hypothetical protein